MTMPAHLYVAIVDDDESVARSMSRLLQQAGFHPIAFTSAEQFLEDPLRTHFGCLLVDIQLGGMTGIELHQALIAQGVRVPVIYLTAHDDPASREEALRLGCTAFFRKTDASQNIIAAIRGATVRPRATP
jgi:FixJ family two-component response regulator